jgi:hypothetical protein
MAESSASAARAAGKQRAAWRRFGRAVLWLLLGGPPLGCVGTCFLADTRELDDADLLVHFEPVAPEENGAELLREALEGSWWPGDEVSSAADVGVRF